VPVNLNTEISQRLQERFEFYVIALAFTILGLSIQTASFGESALSDSFELLGWLFLFVSGLVGLSRLEWVPVAYNVHAEITNFQAEAARLRQAQQTGQNEVPVIDDERGIVPIEEAIQAQDNAVTRLKPKLENIEKWTLRKYQIHKWGFILGLLFLLLSRSYGPAIGIVSEI
jgi:hypothetical protein